MPLYWDVRDEIERLEQDEKTQTAELEAVDSEAKVLEARLRSNLVNLGNDFVALISSPESLLKQLQSEPESQILLNAARIRRDLMTAHEEWRAVSSSAGAEARKSLEDSARHTRALLDSWRANAGLKLQDLMQELSSTFADLPSATATDPEFARAAALRAVTKELDRCTALLKADEAAIVRIGQLDQEFARAKERAARLDRQIAAVSIDAGNLAQVLAGLVPHIHTDDCPVCGRDFREVSKRPLSAHISTRIAALTESAGRLQELSREKAAANTTATNIERERGQLQSRQISDETRNQLKARRARLEELSRQLAALSGEVQIGMNLISSASTAARQLDELRSRDLRATTLRTTVADLAERLTIRDFDEDQPVEVALTALQTSLDQQEASLTNRLSIRRSALPDTTALKTLLTRCRNLNTELTRKRNRREQLLLAKSGADDRVRVGRDLARSARDVRTGIVRRVFNDTLNSVWSDLFVRLAPEEQFVPAFALPQASGRPVEAILETIYRAGGKGGNPRAMLSAGNLNTAALTLFLALHLSADPQLSWLVIDDPVQSMDEVHIAQFAALLRTLSKSHGRQIILAMHERPLFEYLRLELSPAFSDDRLVTIELGQAADGKTTLNYEPLIWQPDGAVAA